MSALFASTEEKIAVQNFGYFIYFLLPEFEKEPESIN
jgi:hypothetical protein